MNIKIVQINMIYSSNEIVQMIKRIVQMNLNLVQMKKKIVQMIIKIFQMNRKIVQMKKNSSNEKKQFKFPARQGTLN